MLHFKMSFSTCVIRVTFLFLFIATETRVNAECPPDLNNFPVCSSAIPNSCSVSEVSASSAVLSFTTANTDICYQVTYTTDSDTIHYTSVQYLPAEPSDSDNLVGRGNAQKNLKNLTTNSEYNAKICWSNNDSFIRVNAETIKCRRCCSVSFNTSSINPRVQVFSPLLNISSAVSAQIVWNPVNDIDSNVQYDVQVFDNSIYNNDVAVFKVSTNETFVNVINTMATNQETLSVYPLIRNSQYTVQVRAANETHYYPWPLPRTFTAETESQAGIEFIFLDSQALWVYSGQGIEFWISNISPPIAFDKLNRVVFYYDNPSQTIKSRSFATFAAYDSLLFQVNEVGGYSITAMTYDWISKKLYFIVRLNSDSTDARFQLYSLTVDGTGRCKGISNKFSNEIVEMIVDPIFGLIYWTEQVGTDEFTLNTFNLSSKQPKMSIDTGLRIWGLALDARNGCVYRVKDHSTGEEETNLYITNSDGGSSDLCVFNKSIDDDVKRIAVSERGVYVLTDSINYYENGTNSELKSDLGFDENYPAIISFDSTSPGTQPLPERPCLSPLIAQSVDLTVSEYNDTWFVLEWNEKLEHRPDCMTRLVSFPPVTYRVTVSSLNEPLEFFTTSDVPSVNVTGVNNPSSYRVRLQATTEYTIANDDGKECNISVPPPYYTINATTLSSVQSSTVQSTVEVTTMTSFTRPTSLSTAGNKLPGTRSVVSTSSSALPPRRGPGETSSPDNIAVVAGVTGGVGFVILILVVTIVILSMVLCLKSKRKSYHTNSNSARYVKSNGMNNSGARYVSQEIPFSEQMSADPIQYESPVTLGNHSVLNSGQSSSNTSGTFAQYATPIDSLEEYRTQTSTSSHHLTPPTNPTPYAVPADSLQQYRSSQVVGSPEKHVSGISTLPTQPYAVPIDTLKVYKPDTQQDGSGQEYEVPLSLSQQSNGMTSPTCTPSMGTSSPTGNLYSTVDDANAQKKRFTNSGRGTDATPNSPPSYASLHQANMDKPHSYTTTTGITEASQLYSEPITSSHKKITKRSSATLPHIDRSSHSVAKPFDNPVYGFEEDEQPPSRTGGGIHNHTYSVLNRKTSTDGNLQPHSQSRSQSTNNTDYSKIERKKSVPSVEGTEPMYFELENSDFKRKLSEPDNAKNSNPTSSDYHQLDRSMVTRTHSNPHSKPSAYHQLQRPNLSSMKLPHSKTNGRKISDPTYQVLEKPESHSNAAESNPDSQTSNPEPMYSVLEDNSSKLNGDPADVVTTKPEPTYFELQQPTSPSSSETPVYFEFERKPE